MYDAVCVGESMILLTPDPLGSLRTASALRVEVAGAESNVATYLAMLGLRSAWAGAVGADPLGEIVRDRIASHGVDLDLTTVDPGAPTGVYFKDPGPAGTTVHYYRRESAASRMEKELWDRVALTGTRLIHLTGITPALSQSCADLVSHALNEQPVPGATMSFDLNYRPKLWPAERAASILTPLAQRADIVFVGLDEAQTLWGTSTAEQVRSVLPEPSRLVVKDGAVGATSFGPDGEAFVPAPTVDVVEPVGAGDAFAAGYLYGLLRDRGERERLRLGHLLAGAALRAVGDIGVLPPEIGGEAA